jgi:hypothetical protein
MERAKKESHFIITTGTRRILGPPSHAKALGGFLKVVNPVVFSSFPEDQQPNRRTGKPKLKEGSR